MTTDTAQRALKLVLRAIGAVSLLATLAVFMPRSWMAITHRWLGLGEFPRGAIVDYLARSLSALYAMTGGMLWIMGGDVRRYAGMIRYWGWGMIVFGVVLAGVDAAAGLPLYWTAGEGVSVVVFGGILLVLEKMAFRRASARADAEYRGPTGV